MCRRSEDAPRRGRDSALFRGVDPSELEDNEVRDQVKRKLDRIRAEQPEQTLPRGRAAPRPV